MADSGGLIMREAQVKARFVKGINKIFRQLSIEFQYLPRDTGKRMTSRQSYEDDFGAPLPDGNINDYDKADLVTVYEPLIDAESKSSTQLIEDKGSNHITYNKLWISKTKLPLKTLVLVDNTTLFISKVGSYQHYAGVYLYYLSGRDDVNDDPEG